MADVNGTITKLGNDGSCLEVFWETLTSTNTAGSPVEMPEWADRTVQLISANFDGGTLTMQGSMEGTNWVTLTDPQGTTIAKTAVGGWAILEHYRYMRPILSGASGAADVDVRMLMRRTSGMRT